MSAPPHIPDSLTAQSSLEISLKNMGVVSCLDQMRKIFSSKHSELHVNELKRGLGDCVWCWVGPELLQSLCWSMDGVLGCSSCFLRTGKQVFEPYFCSLVYSICLETLRFEIMRGHENGSETLSFCVCVSVTKY